MVAQSNLTLKFYYGLSLQAVAEPYLRHHQELFHRQTTLKITATMRIARIQFGHQKSVHLR